MLLGLTASVPAVAAWSRSWQVARRLFDPTFRITEMLSPSLVERREKSDQFGFERALLDSSAWWPSRCCCRRPSRAAPRAGTRPRRRRGRSLAAGGGHPRRDGHHDPRASGAEPAVDLSAWSPWRSSLPLASRWRRQWTSGAWPSRCWSAARILGRQLDGLVGLVTALSVESLVFVLTGGLTAVDRWRLRSLRSRLRSQPKSPVDPASGLAPRQPPVLKSASRCPTARPPRHSGALSAPRFQRLRHVMQKRPCKADVGIARR